MRFSPVRVLFIVPILGCVSVLAHDVAKEGAGNPLFQTLAWRDVGPQRGGRVAAVTGIPNDAKTYYMGATGGGVWKTIDAGAHWTPVSDGFFGGSIGAVAVAESDHNVVYAGGGEVTVRGNVSFGDGVWRSNDAGRTWSHVGLDDSRTIPRLRVHPNDPNLVYAAVLGHLSGPNEMRGVYRSVNGGKDWERVKFVSPDVGCVDLCMDPTNPRILYACFWRVRRTPWSLESGGDGSGIWKSTDGGDTWTDVTTNKGMPAGPIGICGVDVSRSNPDNVWAIVEAKEGGVFRSKDGGKTWAKTSDDAELRQRAWYYTRIYADPKDEESAWVVNVQFLHSKDGGKTFVGVRTPHGDNHDLWIAPEDPARMVEGNDGGACVTNDGGKTWSTLANQPTAQIYRVAVDDAFPYRIYGAQQDNSAFRIRSRRTGRAGDFENTAGGESGYIVPKPGDPEVVYGGSYGGELDRVDHRTGASRAVNPWPEDTMGAGAADLKYRFQWNYPIVVSPHDPNTLYAAANVLFRSHDEGASWDVISPDLTRNDKSKQGPSGGPITKDNTSVEYYCTIFAVAESPRARGVLWCGSDDGLIHLSQDDGKTWSDVTPRDLPEWAQINSIEPDPFDADGLYVAATRYKSDDFHPYLYRTKDRGRTWTKIVAGIPESAFTRVVRADPTRRGLLYAGTEEGVFVSFDDGARWESLQLKLPRVPITDLVVKDDDLIAATQGRGFWSLDDLSPLRQIGPDASIAATHLFEPAPAWFTQDGDGDGLVLHYRLPELKEDEVVKLEIEDAAGASIRTFTKTAKKDVEAPPAEEDAEEEDARSEDEEQEAEERGHDGEGRGGGATDPDAILPAKAGMNKFAWDLRTKNATKFDGIVLWGGELRGPRVLPGRYTARLTCGEEKQTVPFVVKKDPRIDASDADLKAQFDFLTGIRDELTVTHDAIQALRAARDQIVATKARDADGKHPKVAESADALVKKLTEIEEALYQTKNKASEDPLNFPIKLNNKLAVVASVAGGGAHRPTAQSFAVRDEVTRAIDEQLARLKSIWSDDVPAFNRLVHDEEVPAVVAPGK